MDHHAVLIGRLAEALFVGINVPKSKVRSRHARVFAEQRGQKADRVRHRGAIDGRQPIGLPRLRHFIGGRRQRELQIRSIGLNPNRLAPVIQRGIVPSSVEQNLGQSVQAADQLRVRRERLAKLGFRSGGVAQHRAERATRLQQRRIILQSQLELPNRSVVLLLTLPDQPQIEMRLGRARVQPHGLVEGRNRTFKVAPLGEPDAYSVVDACRGRACGRVGGQRGRFAGRRQLRLRSRGDQQQESTATDERPA